MRARCGDAQAEALVDGGDGGGEAPLAEESDEGSERRLFSQLALFPPLSGQLRSGLPVEPSVRAH
jgi:hypothetical protein